MEINGTIYTDKKEKPTKYVHGSMVALLSPGQKTKGCGHNPAILTQNIG